MKIHFPVLLFVWAAVAFAQTPNQTQASDVGPTILSRSELDVPPEVATGKAGDYVNFFAYGDYLFTNSPLGGTGTTSGANSDYNGYDGGVGLNVLHYFRTGTLTLNYTGGYRGYGGVNDDPADNIFQTLSLGFIKQVTRHVLFSFHQNAGWNPGGWIPHEVSTPESVVGLNLAAVRSETIVSSAALTFLQTRRLSWVLTTDFSDLEYKPDTQVGSIGGVASFGMNYRLTKKTTLGATGGYQYYAYLQGHGNSVSQSAYLSLQHLFNPRMQLGISGGATRSTYDAASAEISGLGVSLLIPGGRQVSYSPFASVRFGVTVRRSTFSLEGGETVGGGNGTYLASKTIYAGGGFSYVASTKWSFSVAGRFQRMSSLGGGPSSPQGYFNGATSYKLSRHFGLRAGANYTSYSAMGAYLGNSYYNATVGIIFTSADRPVASIF